MNKRTITVVVMLMAVATVWCASAYAADEVTAWQGFWNSVGGFVYNAMPWNWGNWLGK